MYQYKVNMWKCTIDYVCEVKIDYIELVRRKKSYFTVICHESIKLFMKDRNYLYQIMNGISINRPCDPNFL